MTAPFWFVWNPAGYPAQVRHASEAIATTEAERLARFHPGHEFIVLRAVSRSCVEVPSITTKYGSDEIPF